jgi:hypothetical protein
MRIAPTVFVGGLLFTLVACAPAPPPTPTTPAAKPAATAPPAAKASPSPSPSPAASLDPGKTAAPASLTDAEKAEAEAFYRGKTVRILVGFAAGGGYDAFARLTSKHLPKYIPGSPSVVVENMTGASSLSAANHIYNAAPKDGTVMGTFDPALVMIQVVGGGGGAIQFDPTKFPWLGSPTVSTNQCMLRSETGIDSVEKLLSSTREIVFGATQLGNSTSVQPAIMQHYLGAKIKIVTGYDGVNSIKLAVERSEADGSCGTWESFRSTNAEWLSGSPPFARVIVKGKEDPDGELRAVPLLSQYLRNDEARQVLEIAMAPQAAGFVYATAPGLPETRLKALRLALLQAWNDPEYRAETEKAKLAAIPQDYLAIQKLMDQMVTSSPQILRRAKEVLGIQ